MTVEPQPRLRVLDASHGIAGAIMTRLLAENGAVVVRPSASGVQDGARWRYRHRGKLLVDKSFDSCLKHSNEAFDYIIIDTSRDLGCALEGRGDVGLVTLRLDHDSTDLLSDSVLPDYALSALGGLTFITGDPAGTPRTPKDLTACNIVGLFGAAIVLGSSVCLGAERIDIYARECVAWALEATLPIWFVQHRKLVRSLRHELSWPSSAYRTKDHWIGLTCGSVAETARLFEILRLEHLVPGVMKALEAQDKETIDRFDAALAAVVLERDTDQLVESFQSAGLAAARAVSASDLRHDPQARACGFIGMWPDGATVFRSPICEYNMRRRTPPAPRKIDLISLGRSARHRPGDSTGPAASRPLDGVKVLDFTWQLAGPFATMILADLGADVVKIESHLHIDASRLTPPFIGSAGIDTSAYHRFFNRNKRSVLADLDDAHEKRLVLDLADRAWLVTENFRSGTLTKKQLGYEHLRRTNSQLSMCSISGFGSRGPRAAWRSYGAGVAECASGMALATGGERPIVPGRAIADVIPGLVSALAMCRQLYQAKNQHRSSYLEVTQFESVASTLGELVTAGPDPSEEHRVVGSDSSGWSVEGKAGSWPVLDVEAVLASAEQSGFLRRVRNSDGDDCYLVLPATFNGDRSMVRRAGPRLGQHTGEVQDDWLS